MMNKHYRKSIKKRSLKNLRGGWSFFNQSVAPSQECDPNNLSMIKDYTGMATNYKNCCPKGFFGKNSSPYCKQLDLNFQALNKSRNINNDVLAENVGTNYQVNEYSPSSPYNTMEKKKSWYQFWGGKKSRKNNKKKISILVFALFNF